MSQKAFAGSPQFSVSQHVMLPATHDSLSETHLATEPAVSPRGVARCSAPANLYQSFQERARGAADSYVGRNVRYPLRSPSKSPERDVNSRSPVLPRSRPSSPVNSLVTSTQVDESSAQFAKACCEVSSSFWQDDPQDAQDVAQIVPSAARLLRPVPRHAAGLLTLHRKTMHRNLHHAGSHAASQGDAEQLASHAPALAVTLGEEGEEEQAEQEVSEKTLDYDSALLIALQRMSKSQDASDDAGSDDAGSDDGTRTITRTQSKERQLAALQVLSKSKYAPYLEEQSAIYRVQRNDGGAKAEVLRVDTDKQAQMPRAHIDRAQGKEAKVDLASECQRVAGIHDAIDDTIGDAIGDAIEPKQEKALDAIDPQNITQDQAIDVQEEREAAQELHSGGMGHEFKEHSGPADTAPENITSTALAEYVTRKLLALGHERQENAGGEREEQSDEMSHLVRKVQQLTSGNRGGEGGGGGDGCLSKTDSTATPAAEEGSSRSTTTQQGVRVPYRHRVSSEAAVLGRSRRVSLGDTVDLGPTNASWLARMSNQASSTRSVSSHSAESSSSRRASTTRLLCGEIEWFTDNAGDSDSRPSTDAARQDDASFPTSRRSSESFDELEHSDCDKEAQDSQFRRARRYVNTSPPTLTSASIGSSSESLMGRPSILKLPTEQSDETRAGAARVSLGNFNRLTSGDALKSRNSIDPQPAEGAGRRRSQLGPGFFRTKSKVTQESSDENGSLSWSSFLSNTLSTTSDTLSRSFGKISFAALLKNSFKKSFNKSDHWESPLGSPKRRTNTRQHRDKTFRIVLPNGGHLSGLTKESFGTSARVKVSGILSITFGL